MKLRVAGFAHDSIVDGVGVRLTVFTQGCFHNCPYCHNPQTHDPLKGELYEISDIVEMLKKNPLYSGITISGGEPFLQPAPCSELAKSIKSLGKSVWCYTGFTYEHLIEHSQRYMDFLKNIDVLVDGPFIEALKSPDLRFRGSSNQRLINIPETFKSGCVVTMT